MGGRNSRHAIINQHKLICRQAGQDLLGVRTRTRERDMTARRVGVRGHIGLARSREINKKTLGTPFLHL